MNSYKVVESDTIEGLEKAVTELLEKGWKPSGGFFLYISPQNYHHYYQAMVKIYSSGHTICD